MVLVAEIAPLVSPMGPVEAGDLLMVIDLITGLDCSNIWSEIALRGSADELV